MSIKHYCDICNDELNATNYEAGRLRVTSPTQHSNVNAFFDVMVGLGSTSNNGEFCTKCILDTFYTARLHYRAKLGYQEAPDATSTPTPTGM